MTSAAEENYNDSLLKVLEESNYKSTRAVTRSKSLNISISQPKTTIKKRKSEKFEVQYEESEEELNDEEKEEVSKEEAGEKKEGPADEEEKTSEIATKKITSNSTNCREKYEEILSKIREMRKNKDAPVDLVGSHLNYDPNSDEKTRNFQWLTSIVLSVQTKDERTHQVMKRLLDKGLSLDYVYNIPEKELYELIFEINFNKKKASFLKQIAKIIKEDLKSTIPDSVDELVKLPGIGKKIAILYVQFVKGTDVGIAVDTHVHRISNRLSWVKTTVPDKTREGLESFIDKKYWAEVNQLLVGFGQQVCQPTNPKCNSCLINEMCPEGRRNRRGFSKVVRKKTK